MKEARKQAEERNRKAEERIKEMDKLDYTNIKQYVAIEMLTETKEELTDTKQMVKTITKKLDIAVEDRVIKTTDCNKHGEFVVLRAKSKDSYKYYIIKGQKSYVNT
jgi:DNA-binding ferritin-like protein